MAQSFQLDPRLIKDGDTVLDLKLSRVLLVNNALFPWVILVPRRNDIREIIELNKVDQAILMEEISLVSEVMMKMFTPHKLNIAALGNIVPQLHVHIIARYTTDTAWPSPIFGKDAKPYPEKDYKNLMKELKKVILTH